MSKSGKVKFIFALVAVALLGVTVLLGFILNRKIVERSENSFTLDGSSHLYDKLYSSLSNIEFNDACNYYTFDFTNNGVTYNKILAGDNVQISGATFASDLTSRKLSIPKKNGYYMNGKLYIENNYVNESFKLSDLFSTPLKIKKASSDSANDVIIYFTHTTEGYCETASDRTNKSYVTNFTDGVRNVVAMGNIINDYLNAHGVQSIINTTVHKMGATSDVAYDESIKTLKTELSNYPSSVLAIDVHRDAAVDPSDNSKWFKTIKQDGVSYAPIMLVLGLDYDQYYNKSSLINPFWKSNLKLYTLILLKLEEKVPGITRGITLRRNPYNQQLCQNSVLVEIGFDGNLVSEASNSAKVLAEVIAEIYS